MPFEQLSNVLEAAAKLGEFTRDQAARRPFSADSEGQKQDSEQKEQIKKLLKKVDAKLGREPHNKALLNARKALIKANRASNLQERIGHLNEFESSWNESLETPKP